MTTVGSVMMAHMIEPDALAVQARVMTDTGAQVVHVTDSAGAMTPDDVRARVNAVRQHVPDDVAVGIHAHHNLSFGVANSLAAVEAGATWVDGCTCGLGAGAGNAPSEVFVAAADKLGIDTGVDVLGMVDVAADVVRPDHRPDAGGRSRLAADPIAADGGRGRCVTATRAPRLRQQPPRWLTA